MDWVSIYAKKVPIPAQHKIKKYLKLDKKETVIALGSKWLYISEEILKVDDKAGETTKYRIIGVISSFSLFLASLDKVKSIFISSVLGLIILVILFLFSVSKQFVLPSLLLFEYIKGDGKGNILLNKWHTFWQPWFNLTRERFGLKQKQINELQIKIAELKAKEKQQ